MVNDADKEQIDALKVWWKENGRVVVAGLVIGLGGVFGWQSWQTYTTRQAENASIVFEQMVDWAAARNYGRVDQFAETLLGEYPKSGYAPLGALIRAHSAVSQNRSDEARGYLQWVIDNADDDYLAGVASLRLARLAADKQEYGVTLRILGGNQPEQLDFMFEELRGDVQLAQGDVQAAHRHYQNALSSQRISPSSRSRVIMKAADLGVESASAGRE